MTWFSRLRNWQTDQANGIGIRSDYHDEEDDNFAEGVNECINYEGLNTPIANLPMGGYKHTGCALGVLSNDYATLGQAQASTSSYAVDAVGTDSYAITPSPAISAYVTGQSFSFYAATTNTGAATLSVSGLTAKSIKKDGSATLSDNDIVAGQVVRVTYDGTNFQMQSPIFGSVGQNGQSVYAADAGVSDSYAITLSPAPLAYITGMVVNFKPNTANTGTATLNVNGLGAKTILKDGSVTLEDNDIKASQIIKVIYDGTNFQMISPIGNTTYLVSQSGRQTYAADAGATDDYAITLSPVPAAYVTGMTVRFKANTANTTACTLNLNSLGAKTIKKSFNSDLITGDILANQIIQVVYDGTNFQMISPTSLPGITSIATGSGLTGGPITSTGTLTVATGVPLQVVQGTLTSSSSTASTSMVDTGLTASITPASSSNNILVTVTISTGSLAQISLFQLVRASTSIFQGDAASSRTRCSAGMVTPNITYAMGCVSFTYLDSPATTSATAYKVQWLTNGGTAYINRTPTDTDATNWPRTPSSIVLMEIKG